MKIAYIMHIDWNWIKQRPQFIAEELSKQNDVTIFYQHRYSRRGYQKREIQENVKPLYVIPKGDNFKLLSPLNRKIWKFTINRFIRKNHPEYLYMTFPTHIKYIDKFEGEIIYDCMDNYPAFLNNPDEKKRLLSLEEEIVNRANNILVSSNKLHDVLIERYGQNIEDKISLVRNGYSGKIIDVKADTNKNKLFTIQYYGTISKWFDFNLVLESLDAFSDIKYELYGPIDDIVMPQHERLTYGGTLEHDKLFENAKKADCFIMPFIVNEVVESVDPVKLYEYINWGKNIICPYYEEISRFEPFVNFYTDSSNFQEQIEKLKHSKEVKYSNQQRIKFLSKNRWANRVNTINEILRTDRTT